jgi:hypothetical protein
MPRCRACLLSTWRLAMLAQSAAGKIPDYAEYGA